MTTESGLDPDESTEFHPLPSAFVGDVNAGANVYRPEELADVFRRAAGHEAVADKVTDTVRIIHREDEQIETIDLAPFRPHPRRKVGHPLLTDVASFVEYVNRHSVEDITTLWGDIDLSRVLAVFDDHGTGEIGTPGWGKHRATLQLKVTADWKHWTKLDGKLVDQQTFAEHIEEGADEIHEPDPATMLEIASKFTSTNRASFGSAIRLDSGEFQFQHAESVDAKVGNGTIEVPQTFALGLCPWEGSEAYKVLARFRYRVNGGQLSLGYKLIRPDKVLQAAFTDVLTAITAGEGDKPGVGMPIMQGTP